MRVSEQSVVFSSSDNDDMGDGEQRRRRMRNSILHNGDARICTQKYFPFAIIANIVTLALCICIALVIDLDYPKTALYSADLKELMDDWQT